MHAEERERALFDAFKSSKSIVSNCQILATGVDRADWEIVVIIISFRFSSLPRV